MQQPRIPTSICSLAVAIELSAGLASALVDFEAHDAGPYTSEAVRQDWGDALAWAALGDRAWIVAEGGERGRVLRIDYPAGAVGPHAGGGQFLVALPPADELWLSYRLKFGEGFDFRLGGKLPGLTSGGGRYVGGNLPRKGDGWSARYMWGRNGRLMVYLYHIDMPGPWGEPLLLGGAAATPGQWHHLAQRIKINTPGRSDGVLEVWFDGGKVLSRSDLRFRVVEGDAGRIDAFFFSTFHGGGSPDWAPEVDSSVYFDDFRIGPQEKGIPVPMQKK